MSGDDRSDDHQYAAELQSLHPDCFGWALCCCGHDRTEAEDVLHTAYLKVLDGRARYAGRAVFKTWLFGVIRHTAFDWRRRTRRRWRRLVPLADVGEETLPAVEAADDDEAAELLSQLACALAVLPIRQREVLHLVFYQELSLSEAASVMGVSVGTARQHYERGKARLRVWLKQTEPSHEQRD